MIFDLLEAAKSGNLPQARAALPGATPMIIEQALVVAVETQDAAMLELVLPTARACRRDSPALRAAARAGYLPGLAAIVPEACPHTLNEVLDAAIEDRRTAVFLCIAEHLPSDFPASLAFEFALVDGDLEMIGALAPRATAESCQRSLSVAALRRPQAVPLIAPRADVVQTIGDLLAHRNWSDRKAAMEATGERNPVTVTPPAHLAAADLLIPFASGPLLEEILETNPLLCSYPNAKAARDAAALEREIPAGSDRAAPRM